MLTFIMEAWQKMKRCAEQIFQMSLRKLQKRTKAMLKRKALREMRIGRLNLHVDYAFSDQYVWFVIRSEH